MKQKQIKGFSGKVVHPSLDIKDKILTLGFRYRAADKKEKDFILVLYKDNLKIVYTEEFSLNGMKCFLDKRGRTLMQIEEKWSLDDCNAFCLEYDDLTEKIAPQGKELKNELLTLLKKYVELESNLDYLLITAWIVGTYFFPAFTAYPFLSVKAPKRSGKSQLLNFLQKLCFNAVKARPTVAALGDTVDALRGTYLIDQADSLGRKGTEELLEILADSYKKSGGKRRIMNPDKTKRSILEIETYCPKAFASIKELPEDLRDRCLTIPLIRSQHNFLDPDDVNEEFGKVRNKLYRFLIGNYLDAETMYAVRKIGFRLKPELHGRTLELWLPIETMFKALRADDNEISDARTRFLTQYSFSEYEPSETEEAIIKTLLEQFRENIKEVTLSPKEISSFLDGKDVFPQEMTMRKKAVRIGWVLKKFNLISKKKRTKEGISHIFRKEKIDSACSVYFPALHTPIEETSENKEKQVDI